jgi:hypothetical protein
MHNWRKKHKLFYVDDLFPLSCVCMSVKCMQGGESGDEVPVWKEQTTGAPTIDEQLSREQMAEMAQLLEEFADVFRDEPGKTNSTEHDFTTGSARPIQLSPYCLPWQAVQEELEEIGVIKPSESAWRAPVVD